MNIDARKSVTTSPYDATHQKMMTKGREMIVVPILLLALFFIIGIGFEANVWVGILFTLVVVLIWGSIIAMFISDRNEQG